MLVWGSYGLHLLFKFMKEMVFSAIPNLFSMAKIQFSMFVYISTPMIGYVNVHAILEARRGRARASSSSDDSGSTQVLLFLLSNQSA